ncbi:MAG TPA: hypothetical protein VN253_02165 [Kofleriaceae bacterium]|nr:hypothetical protein [Kofleriaceae bacterium]
MMQKKMFKVLSAIDKRDGTTFWMRVGSGFTNKDNSVNIYLDVLPKSFQFQLRELDEEDLRRRESRRGDPGGEGGFATSHVDAGLVASARAAAGGSAGEASLPF